MSVVLDNEDAEQMGSSQVKGSCSLQSLLSVQILQKWIQWKDKVIQRGDWVSGSGFRDGSGSR